VVRPADVSGVDGRAAIDQVRCRRPDLLVLDVMMPGVDGLDVCRILRRESDIPVLMLTARSTADDLLLGFDRVPTTISPSRTIPGS
jgi:DNA-binding response OmpR family regulator